MDLQVIAAPVIGGIIGLITNGLAIKMLFRPYKEIYIGKFRLPFTPGLIPKEKNRIAAAIGKIVGNELLNSETLGKALCSDEMQNAFYRKYENIAEQLKENDKLLKDVLEEKGFSDSIEGVKENIIQKAGVSIANKLIEQNVSMTILDVGQFSALLTYSFQILSSLMMLSMVFVMVTLANESAHRIVEVLKEESSLKNPEEPVYEVADGSIDFENVSFSYSKKAKRKALADINLHIRSGETIGIIGGTGSSKSSLVQLIPRLYDATEGTVKVGGLDVKNYDIEALRNQVAVVLQKNILFSGSIMDNLRWGDENATEEEMKQACELAQADEFIMQFPDQYASHIEQGGANVSGGQKQRLCIARALLKKPKILILDDSTSAVDTKTDAMIRLAFKEYIPDTTKIIIAQRISSVQEADRILVLEGGRIQAVGTHEELLKENAIYQEVYASQNRGGETDGE